MYKINFYIEHSLISQLTKLSFRILFRIHFEKETKINKSFSKQKILGKSFESDLTKLKDKLISKPLDDCSIDY